MTIYGTMSGVGIGAKLSFYDGANSLLSSYITTRDGRYGYDNSINGASPTFSEFTGSLRINIEYLGKIYTITSITESTIGCPIATHITFVSTVCRYDIVTTAPIVLPTPSGGGGGGGGGGSSGIPIPTAISNSGTTQSGRTNIVVIPGDTVSMSGSISQAPTVITAQQLKKSKSIIIDSILKKGTRIIIYRLLPNGRKIQVGKTIVLPNGKIRYTVKTAGKYILIQK